VSDDLIFISYRREDTAGYARAIYDQFVQRFSSERVFMDVDAIEPGLPFDEAIEKAIGRCQVLLAIIGRNWLAGQAGTGPRIADPKDFVRREIAAALSRNVRVIPILLDGVRMPSEEELPEDLRALARRSAIEISHSSFKSDVERLISSVGGAAQPKPPGRRFVLYWVVGVLVMGALSWVVYVWVERILAARSGIYEESEPNDQKANVNKIPFPAKIRGMIEHADDSDIFQFTTPTPMKGSEIGIILRSLSRDFTPDVAVYDKEWRRVDWSHTTGVRPSIIFASASNQVYFVTVKMFHPGAFHPGARGAYELEIRAEDAGP
jgi:hypothetical protein